MCLTSGETPCPHHSFCMADVRGIGPSCDWSHRDYCGCRDPAGSHPPAPPAFHKVVRFSGDDINARVRRDKPVANTSLAEWNGKLWALWEAHRPFVLDPVTLDTFGEETLGAFDFPTLDGSISPCAAHTGYSGQMLADVWLQTAH